MNFKYVLYKNLCLKSVFLKNFRIGKIYFNSRTNILSIKDFQNLNMGRWYCHFRNLKLKRNTYYYLINCEKQTLTLRVDLWGECKCFIVRIKLGRLSKMNKDILVKWMIKTQNRTLYLCVKKYSFANKTDNIANFVVQNL